VAGKGANKRRILGRECGIELGRLEFVIVDGELERANERGCRNIGIRADGWDTVGQFANHFGDFGDADGARDLTGHEGMLHSC